MVMKRTADGYVFEIPMKVLFLLLKCYIYSAVIARYVILYSQVYQICSDRTMKFGVAAEPGKTVGGCERHSTPSNKLFSFFNACPSSCFSCFISSCLTEQCYQFQHGISSNDTTASAYYGQVNPHLRKSYLTTASTTFWLTGFLQHTFWHASLFACLSNHGSNNVPDARQLKWLLSSLQLGR